MAIATVIGQIGELATWALRYAQAGYEVFPARPDKSPYTPNGFKGATADPETIRAWWEAHPDALIGCRVPQGYVVIDVDVRHGGDATWKAIRTQAGEWPPTRAHASGRGDGGGHTWWLRPPGRLSTSRLTAWARERGLGAEVHGGGWSAGIDLLHHDLRYTILPPSPHPETARPYAWIEGHGLEVEPAPMPGLLASLLVEPEAAPPPLCGPAGLARPGDRFNAGVQTTEDWRALLEPHGWALVYERGGTGYWRRPGKATGISATTNHGGSGFLYVFTSSTAFEADRSHSPFAVHAVLEHGGDFAAAAAALSGRQAEDLSWVPGAPDEVGADGAGPPAPARLPTELFEARAVLGQVRQAAHARRCAPDAVLHACLARLAAALPHTLELPPIIGGPANLSYIAAVLGAPGTGKSSAVAVATELLPVGIDVDQLPAGSGEGLVEALFGYVLEENEEGKRVRRKRQVFHNAFVYVDEGEVLVALGQRAGSTLLPTLRSIWSGGVLGQTNAAEERRRRVPPGGYAYGVVVAVQVGQATALLDETATGTPQRFAWALATDPGVPEAPPDWPGALSVQVPDAGALVPLEVRSRGYVRHRLPVAPGIADELLTDHLARIRGEVPVEPLAAHDGLMALKVAALLALLDGRLGVSDADWGLAGMVMAASTAARSVVAAEAAAAAMVAEQQTSARLARRHVEAVATEQGWRVVNTAGVIARKVHAEPDRWTRRAIRKLLSGNQREVFDEAMGHAIAQGWVREVSEAGQGEGKRALRPGSVGP